MAHWLKGKPRCHIGFPLFISKAACCQMSGLLERRIFKRKIIFFTSVVRWFDIPVYCLAQIRQLQFAFNLCSLVLSQESFISGKTYIFVIKVQGCSLTFPMVEKENEDSRCLLVARYSCTQVNATWI